MLFVRFCRSSSGSSWVGFSDIDLLSGYANSEPRARLGLDLEKNISYQMENIDLGYKIKYI